MKKKVLVVVLFILLCLVVSSCKKSDKDKMYEISKVNEYLYELDYNDYRFDTNLEMVTSVEDFGCSSVKNGNFYGRNFDFVFNNVPEYVVKVASKEGRHASVGVTIVSGIHAGDKILEEYSNKFELIPNFMLDGINDAGVVASINVVSKSDTAPITGTNPGAEDIHLMHIIRFILDNAGSADEAVELLKSKNIYGDIGSQYNLHYMVADKDKTYVIEMIDNKMVYEEKKGNDQVLTNFYVNMNDLPEHIYGYERYNILKNNYNEGNTLEGMWNLMKRVRFSNAYRFDQKEEWYSEFLTKTQLEDGTIYTKETKDNLDNLKKEYWVTRGDDNRTLNNPAFWFTTHNSVYDISLRKLRVTVQENYGVYYDYEL